MEDRKKLTAMLRDFQAEQKELLAQAEQRLEVMKFKLALIILPQYLLLFSPSGIQQKINQSERRAKGNKESSQQFARSHAIARCNGRTGSTSIRWRSIQYPLIISTLTQLT